MNYKQYLFDKNMSKALKKLRVTIQVTNIQFDPEDTTTQDFNADTCAFYIYLNQDL